MDLAPHPDGGLTVAKDEQIIHLTYDDIRTLLDYLPADEWASIAIRPHIPPSSKTGIRACPPALKRALQNAWELVLDTHANYDAHWQVAIRRFPR